MKLPLHIVLLAILVSSVCASAQSRTVEDFNFDWKFLKGEQVHAEQASFDDSAWGDVRLPHDWSILAGYQKENTAASTGFSEGGIGWYRKSFHVPDSDKGKAIWVEFDGVYCKSEVWINGTRLGYRPSGYTSFSYQLSEHIKYGADNVIVVRADHSAYADSRWYTGSGIYRDVRLVKTSSVHIPQWGVRITTPVVDAEQATVHVETTVDGADEGISVEVKILDQNSNVVSVQESALFFSNELVAQNLTVKDPKLWGIETPNMYTAVVSVKRDGETIDQVEEHFGVRKFRFDSRKGFSLNGENLKIKGVNLHHDAGAVGAAATKAIWERRIDKLKSIGVNAVRMAHNSHSPLLMDVCDEKGMLVMGEFFDEWQNPKEKSVEYLGDEAASHESSKGYSEVFLEWAEKDLKDQISRDFNHPSIILWSIGNEIEWTFSHYSETFDEVDGDITAYVEAATFDNSLIKPVFDRISGGVDPLVTVAQQLSKWVKEEDVTRPVICGSVRPGISFASGYADAVDVIGFNYRASNYDAAHEAFPEKSILGTENWVAYSEWKACLEREFISGIFVWTGFAYLGEAGPWPRKGLNISLFDFAGFKNPRGHFFECLWKPEPKVYMVTTPESESEFSYTEQDGWEFDMHMTAPPVWEKLRLWEWYNVNEYWDYNAGEKIVVQTYTNCEEAELFLNGESFGRQSLADFADDDNIIKWLVPYHKGELKVIGYKGGKAVDEYYLNTSGTLARVEIDSDKESLLADGYDVAHVTVKLFDAEGFEIRDDTANVQFSVTGDAELLAVDNGWEMNVDSHYIDTVMTHNGRALAIVRSMDKAGSATIRATIGDIQSNKIDINLK